jgi:hypothetical protein
VLQEYQKGYMYKTRVLRPSLVVVSKKIEKGEGNFTGLKDMTFLQQKKKL